MQILETTQTLRPKNIFKAFSRTDQNIFFSIGVNQKQSKQGLRVRAKIFPRLNQVSSLLVQQIPSERKCLAFRFDTLKQS